VIRTSGWNMVLRAMKAPQSETAPAARHFKVHVSRKDTRSCSNQRRRGWEKFIRRCEVT
jgi:hypothetical protein